MKVKNEGFAAQVFPIAGGSVTVKPGVSKDIKGLTLNDERKAHYENRGIVFPNTKKRKAAEDKAQKEAADAKAAEDKAAGEKLTTILRADRALTDAQKVLAEAKTKVAKSAAQALVDETTKVLEDLKSD